MNEENIKIIAFYLPQFHPINENDKWWGKGFTEWTSVGKAKPLFRGHYQPRVPADLGYYDLRLPIIRQQQVELAKEAGIYGFCYWHYWFGNKKQLLEAIFDEVLETKYPDFPFCLGWANHSWYAKNWNNDELKSDRLLIKQEYPGKADIVDHYKYLSRAFKDKRYIKVGSKPVFLIFNPIDLPNNYLAVLKDLAIKDGFRDGLFIVGNISKRNETKERLLSLGFDAITYQRLSGVLYNKKNILGKFNYRILRKIRQYFMKYPVFSEDYGKAIKYLIDEKEDSSENVFPTIVPNWDHTPRSGKNGSLFYNSTPDLFEKHAKEAIKIVNKKKIENRYIFLKSWNEWAEGNYMEPDIRFGKGYINALLNALNSINNDTYK